MSELISYFCCVHTSHTALEAGLKQEVRSLNLKFEFTGLHIEKVCNAWGKGKAPTAMLALLINCCH